MTEVLELVRRATDGETELLERHEAFGELVRRFQDMAYGYARGLLGNAQLAEDAAQDAFLLAYERLGQLQEPAAFPGWLKRIVASQCSRITRQPAATERPLGDLPLRVLAGPDGSDDIERTWEHRGIEAAIQALPEHERITTVLYYIDGYSQDEVAGFLEVSVTAVKKRLQRSREHLKEAMMDLVQDSIQSERPSRTDAFWHKVQLATLFDQVAQESQMLVLESMLVEGIDVNTPDANGWTLLHWAARADHGEAVALLLQAGADPSARDGAGHTARDLALLYGHRATAALLEPLKEADRDPIGKP